MTLIVLYLAAIIAANLTITYIGPSATWWVGLVCIGLDLTTRDALHERWNGRNLARNMALLIASGSVLSWLMNRNSGPIALASLVSFAAAGSVDAIVYHVLRDRARLLRINGSNILSALVDSLLFPTVAFGAILPGVIAGQFAAKVAGGFLWSLILKFEAKRKKETHVAVGGEGQRP